MTLRSYRYTYSHNSTSPAAAAAIITLSNVGHDDRSRGVDHCRKKTTPHSEGPRVSCRSRRWWTWASSRPSGFGKSAGWAERVDAPWPSKSWGRSPGPLVSVCRRGRGVSKEARIQADVVQYGRGCSNSKRNIFVSHNLSACVSIVPILL